MQDFHNLIVWQKAHQLVLATYRLTADFPKSEVYGLMSQMRRSAASVPENIAEGCGKQGDSELSRYLYIAMGSASELEYELLLAHDLQYLDETQYNQLHSQTVEARRMLNSLIRKIRPTTNKFSSAQNPESRSEKKANTIA